jgi:hypothetical protein
MTTQLLISVHQETLAGHYLGFQNWKPGIFRYGKKIKGLRGGIHRYAAQARPQIETVTAEKDHFRTETN